MQSGGRTAATLRMFKTGSPLSLLDWDVPAVLCLPGVEGDTGVEFKEGFDKIILLRSIYRRYLSV